MFYERSVPVLIERELQLFIAVHHYRTFYKPLLFSLPAITFSESGSVLFYPCNIMVHPVLQEIFAAGSDVAGVIKQPVFYLDEYFGLAESRYIQKRENVA